MNDNSIAYQAGIDARQPEINKLYEKNTKLRKALEKAEEFIENGIEYGYIIMNANSNFYWIIH